MRQSITRINSLLQGIEKICRTALTDQNNVLVEYLIIVLLCLFFFFFLNLNHLVLFFFAFWNMTKTRYEGAILQNKLQGTPVVPVFVAETMPTGDFEPFDFRKVQATLPNVRHKRGASASDMLSNLWYSLSLSLSSSLWEPIRRQKHDWWTDTGARYHKKRLNSSAALQWQSTKYLPSFLPSLLPSFLSSFFSLYFLAFVSFCIFYFDDCLSETNSLSETKILKVNGIHLKHRGEDKGELDLLVQSLMEAMQMRKG